MKLKASTQFINITNNNKFLLESGEHLDNVRIAFQSYGKLNKNRDNVILVCHALTGNAHAAGILSELETDDFSSPDFTHTYSKMFKNKLGWWDSLIGTGKAFDTNKYFVICSNILGSCYGSTGPISKISCDRETFKSNFPSITIRDMVKAQKLLIDKLNIKQLVSAVGGSLGGMQVLEWAHLYPNYLKSIIPIATAAKHSAWAIGLNRLARKAIFNDPNFNGGNYNKSPKQGLALAREIAMVSYRSYFSFKEKFNRNLTAHNLKLSDRINFEVENYLEYQGLKFINRFDANSYISISNAMDFHNVKTNNLSVAETLNRIKVPSLIIGISSDNLYPVKEQQWIADNLSNSSYFEIDSIHGHDAFLIEFDQLNFSIKEFLKYNNL